MTEFELAANPFVEKKSTITYSLNGTSLTKNIVLTQIVPAILIDGVSDIFKPDGSTYKFYVKSNSKWTIKSIELVKTSTDDTTTLSDYLAMKSTDNMTVGLTDGYNTTTGTAISFTVVKATSSIAGAVKVTFECADSSRPFDSDYVILNISQNYFPPKATTWAGSNIYWNGTTLTFDAPSNITNAHIQGVYFLWGSLWGVDPSGANGSTWTTSKKVYKLGSDAHTYTVATGITWSSIPYYSANIVIDTPLSRDGLGRNHLYVNTDPTKNIGDICKFLTDRAGGHLYGKKWRIPTANDLGSRFDNINGSGYANITSNDAAGLTRITAGLTYTNATPNPFIPAAGYRGVSGALTNVGSAGFYWTGSPAATRTVYYRSMSSSTFGYVVWSFKDFGAPIRCVAD